MEAKQSKVLEKLQAREDARRAQREQKQEKGLTTGGTSSESAAAFLQQFSAQARSIQHEIEAVYFDNSKPGSAESSTKFQILNDKLGRLEDSISLASYYLLQYDVRQCLERIKDLKDLLQAAKGARQPRKKFSFSGKAITSMENSSKTQIFGVDSSHEAKLGVVHQPEAVLLQPKGRVISELRATDLVIQRDELTEMDDVTISNLQECRIHILGPIGALYIHQIKSCIIVTGPVVGASYIEDAQDSKFYIATRQARIHGSFDCQFYLYTLSNPSIENSSRLGFGPYSCKTYNEVAAHLAQCGFLGNENQWMAVQDFGWLKSTPSPNWALIPEEQREDPPGGVSAHVT